MDRIIDAIDTRHAQAHSSHPSINPSIRNLARGNVHVESGLGRCEHETLTHIRTRREGFLQSPFSSLRRALALVPHLDRTRVITPSPTSIR
mmetsp:Transcript_42058/g.105012  ORF Transcript_42058/g.105012 Transcript_42058/m.105012 type:complete len:91 (-) Transcript_42058:338-610(-)